METTKSEQGEIVARPGRMKQTKRKYLIREVVASSAAKQSAAVKSGEPESRRETDARFARSRHEWIAELAYYKAERRGFKGGDPDRDWYEAEKEVEEWLRKDRPF